MSRRVMTAVHSAQLPWALWTVTAVLVVLALALSVLTLDAELPRNREAFLPLVAVVAVMALVYGTVGAVVGLTLGGHRQEDRFWEQTLTRVAGHFGHEVEVDTQVVCVDRRRQWKRAGNVWQSSAIRSTLYMLGAPLRLLRRRKPVA